MKNLLCLIIALVPTLLFAQDKEKIADSRIEKVTVFFEGAQITRQASVQLDEGSNRLVVKGLSSLINPQSIQVKTDADLIISGVEYRYNYLDTGKPEEEIGLLTDKQKELRLQIELLQNQLSVYAEEENLLKQNVSLKGQNSTLQALDIKAAADFMRLRLTEIRQKQFDIQKSIRSLNEQIGKITNQMGEINMKKPEVTGEICITMSSKKAMISDITLTYFASGAGWQPNYDIRVKDISEAVKLVQKADVHQKTGENWNKVKLTLSTGTPTLSNIKPKLSPWYLGSEPTRTSTQPATESGISPYQSMLKGRISDRQTGEMIPFANVVAMSNGKVIAGATTDFDGNFVIKPLTPGTVDIKVTYIGYTTANLSNIRLSEGQATILSPQLEPNTVDLQEVVVSNTRAPAVSYDRTNADRPPSKSEMRMSKKNGDIRQEDKTESGPQVNISLQQSNFEYAIELPYKIPTDGKNISVVIAEKQLNAIYEYQATPKLEKAAFLIARIPGWQDYQLISGNANLYFEGTYLGKSMLNVNTTDDTLQLSLGRDQNIVIDRVKVKDKSSTQIFGSNQKIQRGWEISIRNNRSKMIPLVLEDQIPLSNSEVYKVEPDLPNDAKLDETTGKISWKLTIEPGQTKKINFRYTVKSTAGTRFWME